MDNVLKEIEQIARRVACNYLDGNIYTEDVVQEALIKFYKNRDKIDLDNLVNWTYTVVKHLCLNLIDKDKRNLKLKQEIELNRLADKETIIDDYNKQTVDNFQSILEELDSYTFINDTDKKILKKYLLKEQGLTQLSRSYKIKKSVLKKRIYQALREIKFFEMLSKDVVDFNTIPGTKMHTNVSNFLKALEKALIDNNLSILKNYLRYAIIHDTIAKINLKQIVGHRISLLKNDSYRLTITYQDNNDNYKVFGIKYSILDNKRISVDEIPIFPKSVKLISQEYAEGKKGLKMLTSKRGIYNGRLGSLDGKIDRTIGKVIQDKSDFVE